MQDQLEKNIQERCTKIGWIKLSEDNGTVHVTCFIPCERAFQLESLGITT